MLESIVPEWSHVLAYLCYYLYIVVAALAIPGPTVSGHPTPKRGPQLQYKIIGFRLTIVTIVGSILFGGMISVLKPIQLFNAAYFANNFWPLFVVVNIFALLTSIFLYIKGKYNLSLKG